MNECLFYFADNPRYVIKAYIESGDGIDRAGGLCHSSAIFFFAFFFFFALLIPLMQA